MNTHWLGVDTGGTFTDFVYFDGTDVRIHKVLSTPDAPERAILQGIAELELATENLHVIHGSTVATNAVLEGKGVKTAYITNSGFTDILLIGRQARRELYNLMPEPVSPLIDEAHCLPLDIRVDARGDEMKSLEQADLESLIERIKAISPRAIAINFLFSFLNHEHEQQLKEQIKQALSEVFISCSSEVLAEYREYERGMATALNAYVGPLMQGYLQRLSAGLGRVANTLSVMQSSGGTIDAQQAGEHAVSLLLSGPAGGLKGAQYVASLAGEKRLLSFDMGGTSTDVALMDGRIRLTSESHIGRYPVAVPMVDMHTIGAGGGSIAFVDEGGLLNVGPRSAGASPGPACYGNGGLDPTVTDANLILGRLRADGFLGKGMSLDIEAAREAMQKIAQPLELTLEQAALGVVRIANEHMVRALRTISVQKGYDPQSFALTCFGGAGGLHVCALADALAMERAIVPVFGGVLSALGMLVSAPSRELSQSFIGLLNQIEVQDISHGFAQLEAKGLAEISTELVRSSPMLEYSLDLRYQGQSFTLNIDLENSSHIDLPALETAFHQLHQSTYGHALDMPVELVNLRLSLKGESPPFALPDISADVESESITEVDCYGVAQPLRVYQRESLCQTQVLTGPALILEKVSTTFIEAGWQCEVDSVGNLLLTKL